MERCVERGGNPRFFFSPKVFIMSYRPWIQIWAKHISDDRLKSMIRCKDVDLAAFKLAIVACDSFYEKIKITINGIEYSAPSGENVPPLANVTNMRLEQVRERMAKEIIHRIDLHQAFYEST